jgi:hypothetical protein
MHYFVAFTLYRGFQKYHPLLRAPRAAGPRNIYVGFADVTRIRLESGAYVTQMLRAKLEYDVRHVARVHHANVARNMGPLCSRVTRVYGSSGN